MDKTPNRPIKDMIDEYPQVGRILDEYGIECVACSVGTCLLNDIVAIHNLAPEAEQQMMTRIARAIYPDRDIRIPARERNVLAQTERNFSPPVRKLLEEHTWIKRWANLGTPSCIVMAFSRQATAHWAQPVHLGATRAGLTEAIKPMSRTCG